MNHRTAPTTLALKLLALYESPVSENQGHICLNLITEMALVVEDKRAGAVIVHGAQECYQQSVDLLEEMGFPKGVFPLKDLVECGRVKETGFVWMKQKAPYEHYFVGSNTRASYETEVTAYVEKGRMKKMTGIKSKLVFLWLPITEMIMEEPSTKKITFKTPMGIGRSFPVTAFMTEEEKHAEVYGEW